MIQETPFCNSVFEQPWWLDIVAKDHWHEIIVKEEDKVIARLPYVLYGKTINNPQFTQTLGIWFDSSVKEPVIGNHQFAKQKELYKMLVEQLPNHRNIDFVFDSEVKYILPFRWLGFEIKPEFSYRIFDIKNKQINEDLFDKLIRRSIRTGRNKLIIDQESLDIDAFIELQNKTFARQNRKNPYPLDLINNIISKAIENERGKLFFVRDSNGVNHAASFILYDEKVCYHLMSGQDASFGFDGAMALLFYNELLFAKEHSKDFDFEGSMIEGIEQVYRRYGGDQIINWHVSRHNLCGTAKEYFKPIIKRMLHYKT